MADPKPRKPRAKAKAGDGKPEAAAGAGATVAALPPGTMTARCRKCALDQPGATVVPGGDLLSGAAAAPDRCVKCGGPVAWWCATHSPGGPVWFDGPECPDCAAAARAAAATTVARKPVAAKGKAGKAAVATPVAPVAPAPMPAVEAPVPAPAPAVAAKKRGAKSAAAVSEASAPAPAAVRAARKPAAAPGPAAPSPAVVRAVAARAPEIAGVGTEGVVRRCTNCGTEYAAAEAGAECHVCFEKLGWWCRRHSPAGGAWLSGITCPGCVADAKRGPRGAAATPPRWPAGGVVAGGGRSAASGSRALGLAAMAAARRLAGFSGGGPPVAPEAGVGSDRSGVTMVPAFGAAAAGDVAVGAVAGVAAWALSALHGGLAAAAVHGAPWLDPQTKATILVGTAAAVLVALARGITAVLLVIRAAALAGAVWFLAERHHAGGAAVMAAAGLYVFARPGRSLPGLVFSAAALGWFLVAGEGGGSGSSAASRAVVPAAAAAAAAPSVPANPDIPSLPVAVGPRRVLAGSGPVAASGIVYRPPQGRLTAFGGDTSARTFTPGSAVPPETTTNVPANAFRALAASGDGTLLADVRRGTPTAVGIYRLSSGAFTARGRAECRGAAECLAVTDDGHAVAAGRADGTVELFDGEGRGTLTLTDPTGGPLKAVAFASGGERLAAGGPLGFACWNLSDVGTSPETQWRAPGARGVLAVAWLPGGRTLATVHAGAGGAAGERGFAVRFWDTSGSADLPMREAAFADGPAPVAAALRGDLRQVAVSLPGAPPAAPALATHDLPRP